MEESGVWGLSRAFPGDLSENLGRGKEGGWASVPVVMVNQRWGQALLLATPFRGLTLILAGLVTPTAKPGQKARAPA